MKSNWLTISYFNHTKNNNNDWTKIFHDFIYANSFELIDGSTHTNLFVIQIEKTKKKTSTITTEQIYRQTKSSLFPRHKRTELVQA